MERRSTERLRADLAVCVAGLQYLEERRQALRKQIKELDGQLVRQREEVAALKSRLGLEDEGRVVAEDIRTSNRKLSTPI